MRPIQKGSGGVTGIDEAGRGALAGPVVAAAVVFDSGLLVHPLIRDSKKLTAAQRDQMFDWIQQNALAIGVGMASATTVDRINILQSTMLAMSRAVSRLPASFQKGPMVIDGNRVPLDLRDRATFLVQGDRLIPAISAASIIAKVTRDRIMCELDAKFPVYGFAIHKGYGTERHRDAIRDFGPSPCHRMTFAPMRPLPA